MDTQLRNIAWLMSLSFWAAGADLSPRQQEQAQNLERKLIAPCCWSEPVSTHRSEIALKMKAEIAAFVAAGKTDEEILAIYKQRYGMRILIEPEGARWWWTHVVPLAALALGLALTIVVIRKLLRPLPSSSP